MAPLSKLWERLAALDTSSWLAGLFFGEAYADALCGKWVGTGAAVGLGIAALFGAFDPAGNWLLRQADRLRRLRRRP